MAIAAFFDIALLETLPGRTIEPAAVHRGGTVRSGPLTLYGRNPFAHAVCVQPHEDERKPFTVGLVRVRTTPNKATLELCDRLSNPLIEVDAVVHKNLPLDCVCDLGYGIAPGTVIDERTPIPDYHVLRPGEPTTNTVRSAAEDCTPAPRIQSELITEDGRRKER